MPFPTRYNAYSSWKTGTLQTSGDGTSFLPLGDFPCDEVVIFIPVSGEALDIIASSWIAGDDADDTQFVTADSPSGTVIPVGGNANEIAVRRNDQSATPETVRFIWRKFMR